MAKQACSMVKSVLSKQHKRLYKLKQLQNENKNTKYLQRKIDKFKTTKPNTDNINVELDSRFVDFQTSKYFDLFIRIKEIGNKQEIFLPIKHTKISNKWNSLGKLSKSIRLTETSIILFYKIPKKENKNTRKLGADQGQLSCLTLSDKQVTSKDKHGYDLDKIQDILARKKKGSKSFRRTQAHRKNYINWSINQLNFSNIKELGYEKVKNIRKYKQTTRKLSHWCYTLIKEKLIRVSEDKGFKFTEQDNKFMSQRCSRCGWVHKLNRIGKTFKCRHCEFHTDSDLNAACNHEVESLMWLPQEVWDKRLNHSTGFFWLSDKVIIGQESIVPDLPVKS